MRQLAVGAALVSFLAASAVHAQQIPLFTFETDEFAGESNSENMNPLNGANSAAGFGVTEGTQAFVVTGVPAAQNPIFETTVGGSDEGEVGNNYQAFRSAVTALESGKPVTFNFDFSYDFTNTTTGAFLQPGVIFNNAGAGYQSNLAYGGLAGGNAGPGAGTTGTFPEIGPAALAGGATLTILDPINYTDDFKGSFRMSIPVGLPGSDKPIKLGGSVAGNPDGYYQFRFNTNGGYGGTADYAFDNFYFNVVGLLGDFNQDSVVDSLDIDLLFAATPGDVPPADPLYDVTKDNKVIIGVGAVGSDADYLVRTILGSQYGDANLDRKVNFDDLVKLAQNYNKLTGQKWADASFNGDGKVNFDDLVLLAQNYNFNGTPTLNGFSSDFAADWALAQQMVPEPTAICALGAISLFLRRPRRH